MKQNHKDINMSRRDFFKQSLLTILTLFSGILLTKHVINFPKKGTHLSEYPARHYKQLAG